MKHHDKRADCHSTLHEKLFELRIPILKNRKNYWNSVDRNEFNLHSP